MGNDVNNYYRAFVKLGNFDQVSEEKETQKKNVLAFIVDVISSSMAPVVPAMLAGGMIKVLLIVLPLIHLLSTESQTYAVLTFFGDAPFYFIPIMLAYTAAQKFGVTPMLAVSVAGIMLHPDFTALVADGSPLAFFGLPVTLASYASSVIPILIMVWLMQYIENFFNKDPFYFLYHYQFLIGKVYPEEQRILVENKHFLQEVLDAKQDLGYNYRIEV